MKTIISKPLKTVLSFAVLSAIFCPSWTNAAQREYFSPQLFNEDTDTPIPQGSDYYDNLVKNKAVWEMTFGEWFYAPQAGAGWFGFRRYQENLGIVPAVSYLGNFASNPWGGHSRGADISSSVNLGVGIDLEQLTGVKELDGWSIGNTWVWRFGDNISKSRIGNQFSVQQNYGSQTIQLQSLFAVYNKVVFDDWNFSFKFGRFAAGDNFMSKPIYWLYQNNAFDGNPIGVFKQTQFSAYPGSAWGAFSRLHSSDGVYVSAGVFQIQTPEQDTRHGLDWSFTNSRGVNADIEFGWDFNHDDSGRSPGNISAGFVSDWYDAPHNSNPLENSHYNCTVYFQADYMVWNLGPVKQNEPYYIARNGDRWRDLRGVVLWGVVQYDPYDELALMPLFINGGVLFNAPFVSRADDVLCFGFAYGRFSDSLTDFRKGSYETVFEVNYKFQVNRFMFLQPNLQYVLNPNGGEAEDAFVIGLQFGLNL